MVGAGSVWKCFVGFMMDSVRDRRRWVVGMLFGENLSKVGLLGESLLPGRSAVIDDRPKGVFDMEIRRRKEGLLFLLVCGTSSRRFAWYSSQSRPRSRSSSSSNQRKLSYKLCLMGSLPLSSS